MVASTSSNFHQYFLVKYKFTEWESKSWRLMLELLLVKQYSSCGAIPI